MKWKNERGKKPDKWLFFFHPLYFPTGNLNPKTRRPPTVSPASTPIPQPVFDLESSRNTDKIHYRLTKMGNDRARSGSRETSQVWWEKKKMELKI